MVLRPILGIFGYLWAKRFFDFCVQGVVLVNGELKSVILMASSCGPCSLRKYQGAVVGIVGQVGASSWCLFGPTWGASALVCS